MSLLLMDFNQSVSQTFERSCTFLLVLGFYFRSLLCAALHRPHHPFSVRASSCTPEGVWASGLGGGEDPRKVGGFIAGPNITFANWPVQSYQLDRRARALQIVWREFSASSSGRLIDLCVHSVKTGVSVFSPKASAWRSGAFRSDSAAPQFRHRSPGPAFRQRRLPAPCIHSSVHSGVKREWGKPPKQPAQSGAVKSIRAGAVRKRGLLKSEGRNYL